MSGVMWYLVSFVLLFVGCVLCCAGELWAVVLYLPFVVGLVWNDELELTPEVIEAIKKHCPDEVEW